ncbi:MAG: hypothetical protein RRY18_04475 [Clostridia bacterium]
MEKTKGLYLTMIGKTMGEGKDATEFDVHYIVENSKVSDSGFVSEPFIRQVYMKKGVLKPLPEGTPITFGFDVVRSFNKESKKREDKVRVCDIVASK